MLRWLYGPKGDGPRPVQLLLADIVANVFEIDDLLLIGDAAAEAAAELRLETNRPAADDCDMLAAAVREEAARRAVVARRRAGG
jgi:hypothetical protein